MQRVWELIRALLYVALGIVLGQEAVPDARTKADEGNPVEPQLATGALGHLQRHMQLRRDLAAQHDCILGPAISPTTDLVPHLLGLLDHRDRSIDAAYILRKIDPFILTLWCAEDGMWERECGTNPLCETERPQQIRQYEYLRCRQAKAYYPDSSIP